MNVRRKVPFKRGHTALTGAVGDAIDGVAEDRIRCLWEKGSGASHCNTNDHWVAHRSHQS